MFIIGTSGHIDHGKTSLIKALTGIDCDRLPEEKEREMTIDLGFASLDYPGIGTVSVVDVPGHERFIRNMVAGAWAVDLALLVVAADDGWMPQTEDHFRVLELLGVERIIVVLNKTDLVDAEIALMAEEEIRGRLEGTRYAGADVARVSSRTGEGVPGLRDTIQANLKKLSRRADAGKPYLFVDRVFTSKGFGTVVTGSLKNGAFKPDDEVTVLPGGHRARVKRIESHHSEQKEGSPSQRTALNLTGVSPDSLGRGSIVVRHNFFSEAETIAASLSLVKRTGIKNNREVEILVGTADIKGKVILDSDAHESGEIRCRIRTESPWNYFPGQPFVLTDPGGYRIIGGGRVIYAGPMNQQVRKNLREYLSTPESAAVDPLVAQVHIRRSVPLDDIYAGTPLSRKAVDQSLKAAFESGVAEQAGGYILLKRYRGEAVRLIVKAVAEHPGANVSEIADHSGVDSTLLKVLMPEAAERASMVERDGRFFSGEAVTEDTLPPERKKLLSRLLEQGADGMEIERLASDPERRWLRELVKLGFAVSLDGDIIYHKKTYEECRDRVMALFDTKEKIMVGDVRDATGLSRKYAIPLLNRIENDGLVRRLGDFRIRASR